MYYNSHVLRNIIQRMKLNKKGSNMACIKDLIGQTNIALRFPSREFYACEGGSLQKIPSEILLASQVYQCDNRYSLVYYYKHDQEYLFTIYVPHHMNIEVLSEQEADHVKESFMPTILKNFRNTIQYTGTIGADPEVFIVDKDEQVIPAFHFLKDKVNGDKYQDRYDMTKKIYWDGFQAEFETASAGCLAYHTDNVHFAMKSLHVLAKKYNPDAKFSLKSTIDISPEVIGNSSEEHVQFGCMPSLNAYGMEGLKLSGREVPYRSAGGHIHFGIINHPTKNCPITKEQYNDVVKFLDKVVGVACVSLFAKLDDPRRRMLYGLAGEYRLPAHGLEYRTLSNAWLCHPLIKHMVFDLARTVLTMQLKGYGNLWVASEEETIRCINTCDVALAKEILERNKHLFKMILSTKYGTEDLYLETAFNVFMNGVESVIQDPSDIAGNWAISKDTWTGHSGTLGKCWNNAKKILIEKKKVS